MRRWRLGYSIGHGHTLSFIPCVVSRRLTGELHLDAVLRKGWQADTQQVMVITGALQTGSATTRATPPQMCHRRGRLHPGATMSRARYMAKPQVPGLGSATSGSMCWFSKMEHGCGLDVTGHTILCLLVRSCSPSSSAGDVGTGTSGASSGWGGKEQIGQ